MKGKIFNAQEVQAIIAGNKRMFREVIKPQPILSNDKSYWEFKGVRWAGEKSSYAKNFGDNARPEIPDLCPYQVGQKIFVKESFSTDWVNYDDAFGESCVGDISYKPTWENDNAKGFFGFFDEPEWKPAQHMKQEHSRLTLQIKEIRAERLAEISEEDCWKEGVEELADYQDFVKVSKLAKQLGECSEDPRPNFASHWNSTHKKPEEKFSASPWVWSIQFDVIKN